LKEGEVLSAGDPSLRLKNAALRMTDQVVPRHFD